MADSGIASMNTRERPPWYERQPALAAVETLRGIGQVDLQAKLVTGVLITIGLFAAGWEFGVFGLLGAATSTLTAMVLRADGDRIYQGLEGYCGALIGIAAVSFLGTHVSSWLVAITGGIACTIVTSTLSYMLGTWKLPALTGPFCIVGTAIAVGAPSYERIWHGGARAALPEAGTTSTVLSFGNLVESFFTNVSQIFLIGKWWTGLIMLVGLVLAGPRVGAAAAVGSVIGSLTAWAIGAPADQIAQGLYGYNAVLVMIALGATFLAPTAINMAYAAVAAVFSTMATAAMANLFAPVGGHTLTWPFNLVTWAFLAAMPLFAAITAPRSKETEAT